MKAYHELGSHLKFSISKIEFWDRHRIMRQQLVRHRPVFTLVALFFFLVFSKFCFWENFKRSLRKMGVKDLYGHPYVKRRIKREATFLLQWGSYQTDAFSYNCDEHLKFFFLQKSICMNGRLRSFKLVENERALCVLIVVGFVFSKNSNNH